MFFRNLPLSSVQNIAEFSIKVTRKDIKSVRLSARKWTGEIRLSVPKSFSDESIRKFLEERLGWLRENVPATLAIPKLTYQDGDKIYFLGNPYTLRVSRSDVLRPEVLLDRDTCLVNIPYKSFSWLSGEGIKKILDTWFRDQFLQVLGEIVSECEKIVGTKCIQWKVRSMRSRWGTCNIRTKHICLSLELIHFSRPHIAYVVIHELVHLYEASHNTRFHAFMDRFCPNWKVLRAELNGGQRKDVD